jgi:mannose-6-phosphate isomerase-like protein (cupin superfamily)
MKIELTCLLAATATVCVWQMSAQRRTTPEQASWAPKPVDIPKYQPPHKPHTKIADLKKKHEGHADWRETIVDDPLLHGEYISLAAGGKVSRRFHPDTRMWWIVTEGQMKVEIEGQDSFIAAKGAMVQVPMQTIYSMETVGDSPAVRFHVGIADAKTLYPVDVKPPEMKGFNWIQVKLNRTPGPYERGNKPMARLDDLVKEHAAKNQPNFNYRFVNDDRGLANVIYGYEKNLPPLNPKDRGHYHPESSEFWLIMAGQIRYPIEGSGVVIADEGDIVYVPIYTFHAPRFHGPGPSCRLAMNGYPNIAHLRDAEPH